MKLSIFKKQDKKKDKNLLVAATVIAAMAYQAALSPPGGVASVDATQLQFLLLMVLMTLDLEIRGFSLKRKFQIWIIRVAMWITLSSMTVAYVCAVIATSPTHDLTQLSNTVKALAFAQVTSQLDGHSLDSMPYSVQRNMCCLYSLRLAKNELEGTLPADLGLTLLNLREFYFGGNRLTGPLPPSMTNMSNLVKFDISENNITGPIPYNLGSLPNIQWLSLGPNALGNNMQPDIVVTGAVSWKSSRQTLITRSTFEAELCALDATGTEAEWLHGLMSRLPVVSKPLPAISVHCDSRTTIDKIKSVKIIAIEFIGTLDNIADPLTKGLEHVVVLKSRLGMGPITHHNPSTVGTQYT
ncbi:hypothetical protein AgCh_000429 [Apium graveolens]